MDGSFNPLRRIDWRWQSLNVPDAPGRQRWHAAAKLVADKFPELASDRRRLAGHLRRAFELDVNGKIDRWLIRGSILAGETDEQIEARLQVPASVARLFEAFFFNVRDRLQARDYVRGQAICIGVFGDPIAHIGHWYASVAYLGGIDALDRFFESVKVLASSKRSARGKNTCRNDRLLELAIGLDRSVPGSPDETYWTRAATHLAPVLQEVVSFQVSANTQRRVYEELAAALFRPGQSQTPTAVRSPQPQPQQREELVPI